MMILRTKLSHLTRILPLLLYALHQLLQLYALSPFATILTAACLYQVPASLFSVLHGLDVLGALGEEVGILLLV